MNIVIPKHIYINWHHATYELASYLKQQNAPIKFNVFNIFLGPDDIKVDENHRVSHHMNLMDDWVFSFERKTS